MKKQVVFTFPVVLVFLLAFCGVACPESDKSPNISFSETVFDFGFVYQGEEVTHSFKFQNIGEDTLKIIQVRASCGCSKAEAPIKEIAPGEFGEISVVFNTAGYKGKQTQSISISSNDPLNPTIRLALKGEVKLEVEIEPLHLSLGDIPKYTQITKQFKIIQRGEQELLVNAVTVDNKYLNIDSVEKTENFGKNIYLVSITLSKDAPAGNLVGRIKIETNLKRHSVIWTSLQAKILGHIKISPGRLILKTSPGENEVFPIVLSTEGDNFEILKMESSLKYITAKMVTLEKFREYRLDVGVTPETPIGSSSGDIKIYTNCPGETELKVPVIVWVSEELGEKIIEIGYFFERGCLDCDKAHDILQSLKAKFSTIKIKEYDIGSRENMQLNEAFCEIYDVPEDKRLIAPSIFIGNDYLIGKGITEEKVVELVKKYPDGVTLPLAKAKAMMDAAESGIAGRFQQFGVLAIIAAGLLDGINPCAFATIIFFISYLAILKRKGREIIIVGIAFTAAIFITYFLIGIGLFEFLKHLTFIKHFTKILYALVAAFTLFLGILSFWDFIKCRKGKASESILQLPRFLKDKIHSTIKEKAHLTRYVLAAFITGFIVSVLELACTGQVYLPTIVYATGISDLRFAAYIYLLLYNIMFIAPLIVIFILAYWGTTAIGLSDALGRSMAVIKLLLSVLFFIFTAFLVVLII
ncbi:MAG: DUF1573 domain-containing protein [Candidatus Ratteibacteria bacterium]|nr:DUF1573 domain-containing protein [Candidatus Ratteibacteria bacterium]